MDIIEKYTPKGDFPVPLGSALRNPSYSYSAWGIEGPEPALRVASDRAYHNEWEKGTPMQMTYVIEAAERAGLGNCSNMLRELQTKTIHSILSLPRLKQLRRVNYTEPGAGKSTVMLYQHLIDNGYDVGRLFSTLIEPSETRLEATADELKKLGLKEGKHFIPIKGKDSEMPFYIEPASQHIIAANATLHHHAFKDRVFEIIYNALVAGGIFGNFEWYEGLCEHPARVYKALKNHQYKPPVVWKTKESDLQSYATIFPNALATEYPTFSPADEMAAEMITTFWLDGWAVTRAKAIQADKFDPRDDYFMHEAHGRPGPQVKLLKKTGFKFDTNDIHSVMEEVGYNGNPHQILTRDEMLRLKMYELYNDIPPEGSNLLMALLAQTPR